MPGRRILQTGNQRDAIHALVVAQDASGVPNSNHHPCRIPLPQEGVTLKKGVRDIAKLAGAGKYEEWGLGIRIKGDFLGKIKPGDTALYDESDGFATARAVTRASLDTFNGETYTCLELEPYPVNYLSDVYESGGFSARFHQPAGIPAATLGCPIELLPERWRAFVAEEVRGGRAVYAHPDGKYVLSALSSTSGGTIDYDLGKAGKITGSYYYYFDWLIDFSFRRRNVFLYTVDEGKLRLNVHIDYSDAYNGGNNLDLIASKLSSTLSIGGKKWEVSAEYFVPLGYAIRADAQTRIEQRIAHRHLRNMKYGWSSANGWEATTLLDESDPPSVIPSAEPDGHGRLAAEIYVNPILSAYLDRRVFLLASSDAYLRVDGGVRLQPPYPPQMHRLDTCFDLRTSVELDPYRQFHEHVNPLRFDWKIPQPYQEVLGLPSMRIKAEDDNPNQVGEVNILKVNWVDGVRNPSPYANLAFDVTVLPDRPDAAALADRAPYVLRKGRLCHYPEEDPPRWEATIFFLPRFRGWWTIRATTFGNTLGPLGWKDDAVSFLASPGPNRP